MDAWLLEVAQLGFFTYHTFFTAWLVLVYIICLHKHCMIYNVYRTILVSMYRRLIKQIRSIVVAINN